MRVKYDLVLPLGAACSCAQLLKEKGLRYASYPFDWLIGGGIRLRTDIVMDDFRSWLEKDQLEFVSAPDGYDKVIYRNAATGIEYMHDFPAGLPLSETFPMVKAKYDARVRRMLEALSRGGRVLIVWVQTPNGGPVPEGDIAYCLQAFRRKFARTEFDMRVLEHAEGVPVEAMEILQREGATVCRFDYREYDHPKYPHAVVLSRMPPALRDIRVRDNRSWRVRLEFARECRAAKYERFHVASWPAYVLVKLQYKIYCHLRHALQRRNIVLR